MFGNRSGMKNIILYTGGFELPDKNAAAQRCIANAKILRDLGYEVILLGISKTNDSSLSKSEHSGFTCWSIPYPNSSRGWLRHITSLNQIDYLLENEYKNQVFAVICYNYPAISQYRIRNLAKKNGALALADVTEWYSVSGRKLAHKIIKWLDTSLRMRGVNYLMDGLITTSGYLSNFYRGKKLLVELPTLYDKNQRKRLSSEPGIESKCFSLMYAGSPFDVVQASRDRSCVKEKLDMIIDSLFRIHIDGVDFKLNIFGVTKEEYLKVYPEFLEKLNDLKNKVFFKGKCSHQQVLESLVETDFSIFLRDVTRVTQAGFPSKFAESITYGTPIITNSISNIEPYIVEGMNCYLVDIDDESKRIKKLKEVLSLPLKDVVEAKRFCLESDAFHYANFTGKVGLFFDKLRIENES